MDPMIRSSAFTEGSGVSPDRLAGDSGGGTPRSLSATPAGSGPQLLALERELSGPGAQEALARHDAVLVGLENRLAAALNEGVSPEEYPKLTDLREANVLARKLLRLAQREGEVEQP